MKEKQLIVTEKFSEVRSGLFSPIIPTNFTRWRERSCEVNIVLKKLEYYELGHS